MLQKISDAPLTVCPSCGAPEFTKQVTAAGFQLKGSGWYVTDFRDGHKGGGAKEAAAQGGDSPSGSPAAAPAPAPAPASGGSTDTAGS